MQRTNTNLGGTSIPGTGDTLWGINASEKMKYDQIFDGLKPVNGMLSGDKVRPVLINSKLPVTDLSRVWDLSDIDKDGLLDRDEFAVAMHLVYRALARDPVPQSLPPNLIPLSKRRPPAVPVLPTVVSPLNNMGGLTSLTGLTSSIPTKPDITSASSVTANNSSCGPAWVINETELSKYREMHTKADTDMDGYVNGAEIKDIFLQSGLAQPVLAHIWQLSDTLTTGKLNVEQFALAMYLVKQKVAGIEPPTKLPPEMIPPSMRNELSGSLNDSSGMQELDQITAEIEDLKKKKMTLDQERAQQEADIKIRSGEVAALQKELDAINVTVHMLDKQKAEAQKRLDDLDEKGGTIGGNLI